MGLSILDDLPPHIQRRVTVCEQSGCWIVNGDPSSNGYQRVWYLGERVMAHRLLYVLHYDVRIDKHEIDHLCENKACCNPLHLDKVTASVNCKRRHRRRKKPVDQPAQNVQAVQPNTNNRAQE